VLFVVRVELLEKSYPECWHVGIRKRKGGAGGKEVAGEDWNAGQMPVFST